jgi:hypothetical protein
LCNAQKLGEFPLLGMNCASRFTAEEAARRAQVEADELAIAAWDARMAEGGPAQPSPTLGTAPEAAAV